MQGLKRRNGLFRRAAVDEDFRPDGQHVGILRGGLQKRVEPVEGLAPQARAAIGAGQVDLKRDRGTGGVGVGFEDCHRLHRAALSKQRQTQVCPRVEAVRVKRQAGSEVTLRLLGILLLKGDHAAQVVKLRHTRHFRQQAIRQRPCFGQRALSDQIDNGANAPAGAADDCPAAPGARSASARRSRLIGAETGAS